MSNHVSQLVSALNIAPVIKRESISTVCRALYGNDAGAFAASSKTAAREDFVRRAAALYLWGAVHGDGSKAQSLTVAAARHGAEYRKDGAPKNEIARTLEAYKGAISAGMAMHAALKDGAIPGAESLETADGICMETLFALSPTFGALTAPPAEKVKTHSGIVPQNVTTPSQDGEDNEDYEGNKNGDGDEFPPLKEPLQNAHSAAFRDSGEKDARKEAEEKAEKARQDAEKLAAALDLVKGLAMAESKPQWLNDLAATLAAAAGFELAPIGTTAQALADQEMIREMLAEKASKRKTRKTA